jgi:hypothetical protein
MKMKGKKFGASLTGDDRLNRKLGAMGMEANVAAAAALHLEHEQIMLVAKERTPVDTGNLKGTGHVSLPTIKGTTIVSVGGFGGPAAPYAVIVHERLDVRHRVGQAKYYESALLEAVNGMEKRLGAKLKFEIQKMRGA